MNKKIDTFCNEDNFAFILSKFMFFETKFIMLPWLLGSGFKWAFLVKLPSLWFSLDSSAFRLRDLIWNEYEETWTNY